VGRGRHYDRTHLERLLQVKALQEAGRSLDEIRLAALPRLAAPSPDPLPRTVWRRVELAPGVELHVHHDIKLPGPGRLDELAAWCRTHLSRPPNTED
jgi:DNA-binding transcriptional MerR regulator